MSNEADQPDTTTRFVSIDALRGFDMFWIIGADAIVSSLQPLQSQVPSVMQEPLGILIEQLEHVPWEGFHFYDLIFPLFVFLVGTSTVFSLRKIVEREGKRAAFRRVVRRALLLYCLGLFYYGGLSREGAPETFRYVGVLQRIAVCYFFAGVLYLWSDWKGWLGAAVVLLGGYWALMMYVPVPEIGAGSLEEGKNLANYVDQHFLPGYKWDGDWDPEGLLSTLPAIVSGILGMFAGLLMQNRSMSSGMRLLYLVLLGAACLGAEWLWQSEFPIIKKLWTSSYVLVAGGFSLLFVALFHAIIDLAKLETWARPFVWIGMNPITIYVLANLIQFEELVKRILHDHLLESIAPYGPLVVAILALLLQVWIAFELYRRKVFIRI